MKCQKHPKYQAKRYPISECPQCLEIWNKEQEVARLDPPCDARAYAEYFRQGGSDF